MMQGDHQIETRWRSGGTDGMGLTRIAGRASGRTRGILWGIGCKEKARGDTMVRHRKVEENAQQTHLMDMAMNTGRCLRCESR